MTSAKLWTRSSCLTILNYPRETISRRCCEASGRGGVSPSVLGRSMGAVQRGSEWRQSRIKCDLAVQTAVAFKKIWYVSDSVPHLKVAWFRFENVRFNATCAVHTAKSKSDMGHIWAKKSDSGHLQLQSERSQRYQNCRHLWKYAEEKRLKRGETIEMWNLHKNCRKFE